MIAPVFALIAGAAAAYSNSTGNATTVVDVVTDFTTYCPEPTTFVANNKTYTITEATTLTITDCPCTIHPATTEAPVATSSANKTVAPTTEAPHTANAAAAAGVAGVAGVAAAVAYLL